MLATPMLRVPAYSLQSDAFCQTSQRARWKALDRNCDCGRDLSVTACTMGREKVDEGEMASDLVGHDAVDILFIAVMSLSPADRARLIERILGE